MMLAAAIRFFDGRHPRLTQVPPRVRFSVIAAVLPSSAARMAAAKAVAPEPKMTKSKRRLSISLKSFSAKSAVPVKRYERAPAVLCCPLPPRLKGQVDQGCRYEQGNPRIGEGMRKEHSRHQQYRASHANP